MENTAKPDPHLMRLAGTSRFKPQPERRQRKVAAERQVATDAPRTCLQCQAVKTERDFYNYPLSRGGKIKPTCKECDQACAKATRRPGYHSEYYKAKRAAGWKQTYKKGTGYKYVKAWRSKNKEEAKRRDRVYAKLRRPGPERDGWERVKAHYGSRCLCCGQPGVWPDHVIPVSQGGTNQPSNLQPLCPSCNGKKINKATDYRPDKGARFANEPMGIVRDRRYRTWHEEDIEITPEILARNQWKPTEEGHAVG